MAWSYRFADALSDVDIATLELTQPSFEALIITPGMFRATVPVPNRQVADQVRKILPDVSVDPGTGQTVTVPQSIVHVYDGLDLWDSYLVWTADLEIDARGRTSVALQGAELASWLHHRMVDQDLDFTQVDQIEIARRLLIGAQVGWGVWSDNANMGIVYQSGMSGVLRDRLYRLSEATMVGQRLEELANVETGFEWRLHSYANPDGSRVRLWKWGYPILGGSTGRQVYTLPGNITSLRITRDLTGGGTAFWARGDTDQQDLTDDSQPVMTRAPWMRTDLLARGWPWLDSTSDHQGVTEVSTLDNYARAYAAAQGGMVRTMTLQVRMPHEAGGRQAANFRPAKLGDRVRLSAVSDFWPPDTMGRPSLACLPRVVGIKMTPSTRERGQDLAELVVADDSAAPTIAQAPQ